MPQLYPDGVRDINMARATENGSINTPPDEDFNTEAMRGSMQQFLSENLGVFVSIEFLIGTDVMTRKDGILYSVGRSVLALYEELSQTFVLCDIFSVKFVTMYQPGQRPGQLAPEGSEIPQMPISQGHRPPMGRGFRSMGSNGTR